MHQFICELPSGGRTIRVKAADEHFLALHVAPPAHPELVVSVVIPARNEAELLPRALHALDSQRGLPSHSYEVIVLVNNSTDHTAAVARRFAAEHAGLALHVLTLDLPDAEVHIGRVRRMLMDEACRRLESRPRPLKLILSTDADSQAAPDWIAQNVREVRQGAGAVGGAIYLHTDDRAALPRRVREMQRADETYNRLCAWLEDHLDPQAHDRWPRHQHHFGASFAITTDAYRLVGGLPPEESLEDVALYQALVRHDVPFRHSPHVQVFTSGRLEGRVTVGLSEQLTTWRRSDHAGTQAIVPSVEYLVRSFQCRREFRQVWQARHLPRSAQLDHAFDRLCRHNQLDARKIAAALQSQYFGNAWEQLDLSCEIYRQLGERAGQPLMSALTELEGLQKQAPPSPHQPVPSAAQKDRADSIPA